jgi:ABC-2 type transport system ATP-binding protein
MMLELHEVTRRYANRVALDKISFQINAGECVGLLGPNGAGKTTLFRLLTTFLSPTSGTITLNGKDIFEDPLSARSRIGYLPETPPLYLDMKVIEFLRFVASIKKIPSARVQDHIDYVMEAVKIAPRASQILGTLSKGFRQRVGLAMAILSKPDFLILDEPTVGLDPHQSHEIRELIRGLTKTSTVMLSSHLLGDVESLCGKLIVLDKGRLITVDSPSGLRAQSIGQASLEIVLLSDADKWIEWTRREFPWTVTPLGTNGFSVEHSDIISLAPDLIRKLSGAGADILEVSKKSPSLETVFRKLTA